MTEIIEVLHRLGISEKKIAEELDLPLSNVKGVIALRRHTSYLAPEDKELADAMRDLAWRAYREAKVLIEFGSPGERLGLIKTILARTASMVGNSDPTRYDEMRNEFEEMLIGFHGSNEFDPEEIEVGSPSSEIVDTDKGSYD